MVLWLRTSSAVKLNCMLLEKLSKFSLSRFHSITFTGVMNYRGRQNRFDDNYADQLFGDRHNQMPWHSNPFVSNSLCLEPPPPPPMIVTCGELRKIHEGKYVEMSGKFCNKRMGRFAELRDGFGVTQLVISEERNPKLARRFENMPIDAMLTIIGLVLRRPNSSRNKSMLTGEIEVEVEDIVKYKMPRTRRNIQKRSYSTMAAKKTCGITSTEYKMAKTKNLIKWFNNRELTCNDLRLDDVGLEVQLIGWLLVSSNSKFQQLKDGYGVTQILIEKPQLLGMMKNVKNDSVLLVKGKVVARPLSNINPKNETGEIEVYADEIRILDPNEPYDGPIKDKIQKLSITNSPRSTSDDNATNSNNNDNADGGSLGVTILKDSKINRFTYRTHNCGELTSSNVAQNVTLCGWLEFQRMKKFVVLRDGYGQIQCVIPENLGDKISNIPYESIIKIQGVVVLRPSDMRNPAMKTGDIEIHATSLELLNEAIRNLPMDVRDFHRAKEALRLEHRYIDLRFSDMQRNLRMRSSVFMKMREYLINHLEFVEVETPTLFRRTPGGAQEFVVPTRKAGHFYSLVQSPQQFKQMLMAGAIDRYFQIARCYRDEATRPDRQPEFTQLDIELSFTNQDSVLTLIEETLEFCWPKELNKIETPFPRITYDKAMEMYGTDKPDTRFELTLKDVSEIVSEHSDGENFGACAIIVKKPNSIYSTSSKKSIEAVAQEFKCKFFAKKITENVEKWAEAGVGTLLSADCVKKLVSVLDIQKDDLLFLAFGDKTQAQLLLGRVRLAFVDYLEENNQIPKRRNDRYNFVWVYDFPMFTRNNDNEQWESTHHPFTAVHDDDLEKLKNKIDLATVKSKAYDLVLNGQEIGGGSIRIHDSNLQKFILEDILNIEHSHLKHLLEALQSGCPPHGGIALGLDRLMSIICDTKSIRDVIAFPKGMDGKDHLSKAPLPISADELKLYHLTGLEDISKDIKD